MILNIFILPHFLSQNSLIKIIVFTHLDKSVGVGQKIGYFVRFYRIRSIKYPAFVFYACWNSKCPESQQQKIDTIIVIGFSYKISKFIVKIIVSTQPQMQMQNMRVTLTPLCICYYSNKPLTIILKLKRILISTNYELEKFECKKAFPLKNNMVDLTAVGQSFGFKLSKELELANTKVDFMVFGLMNKDVKLLGIGTLDLGMFEHVDNSKFPVQQELKINLQRSQDLHAYITTSFVLEMLTPDPKTNVNKQTKGQSEGMNSLKTQSYNRQSLMIGRRKQIDVPSGYEISKKNYKQVELVRNNEQRSRSKSTKEAGSYKKRFQYQSNRSQLLREGQEQPQMPPSQLPQTKVQSKGSPVPRLKTPEPVSDFQMSSTSSIEKNYGKKKERLSPNSDNHHKIDPSNPKNSRNKIKIVVDVYQEHKVIEQTSFYDDDEDIENPRQYIQKRQRQAFKRDLKEPKQQKSFEQERYQQKAAKNPKNSNQIGKISHIHEQSKQKQRILESSQQKRQKNPQKKFNQKSEINNTPSFQSSVQRSQKLPDEKLTYQNYRHSQSLQNHENKPNRNNEIQIKNNQYSSQNEKRPSIAPNRKQNQPKPTKQQKQKSRESSENKYKSITDKLELIQHKIKQGKKPQNSSSPTQNKQASSQNTYDVHNQSDEKHSFQTRKPYSPYTTKDKNENGRVQHKKSEKEQNLSANTFKENYFQSQNESSPGKNNGSVHHVNSFDPMSQSRSKNNGESSNALHSIAEETGNQSHYSDSNMKFSQKQPEIPENNYSKKQEGGNKKPNEQAKVQNKKKQVPKQTKNKIQQTDEEVSIFESSVANFSINQKDDQSGKQESATNKNQIKLNLPNSKKNLILPQKGDEGAEQQNRRKQEELKNSSNQIKKIYTFKQQEKSKGSIEDRENIYPISKQKQKQVRRKNNNINLQVELKIEPTVQQKKQPETKLDSFKKIQNDPKLHKGCEQKITNLENLLDHQQQKHRKQMLEKDLEYRTMLKNQIAKNLSLQQEELKSLRNQNSKLKEKQVEYTKNTIPLNKNESKQSISSPQQVNRLKEQNLRLRNLLDKLNAELEQSDEKHFEALTAVEKKDLQYKRKIDEYARTNQQLLDKLIEIKEQSENLKNIKIQVQQQKSQEQIPVNTVQSEKQIKKDASATNIKSYQEQYLAQKKKSVNLQGQLREKCNQIRFLKIKNDNLLQQKKDLENQIDNIAINNKLEMAKQGSIAKMNLQSASVTNSIKVENRALREEINSLQKQVHELNTLLEGIIVEGNLTQQRLSESKSANQRQNSENLQKKYKALQKKAESYEQQIRQKQLKIAEIINAIFSYGNPKLMDQISKLVGMNQE